MTLPPDLGVAVFGVAAVILALVPLVLVSRKALDRLSIGVGPLRAEVAAVRAVAEAIEQAVNNVPEGSPTLSERVDLNTEWLSALDKTVAQVAVNVAAIREHGSTIRSRLREGEDRFDRIEERLDRIDTHIQGGTP